MQDLNQIGTTTDINRHASGDAITAISTEYLEWRDKAALPLTLLKGTRGMKLAGNKYLPQHPLEPDKGYSSRLEMSTLLNAYSKTISFLAGQVFQADLVFSEEVEQGFVEQMKKCDIKGNDINVFMKRIFFNGLGKGVTHILVDAPEISDGTILSVSEEREQGIRPFLKEIKPESVIGWKVSEDGQLLQIRLIEYVQKPLGKYGFRNVLRIRVFNYDGSWELWEQEEDGAEVLVKSGTLSYKGIPILTFIPGEEFTVLTGETPLIDLAELNLSHWRSNSDQTNILHVGRVPILFGKMIQLEKMPVGVASMIVSEDKESDIKYVEILGHAIKAGDDNLVSLEAKMALYGLQQLIPRSGNMTATEKALTSRESNSSLGTWAIEFENFCNAVFTVFQEMQGGVFPLDGVSVNKEYNLGIIDTAEGELILKAADQGVISAQSAFAEFRRRGTFIESLTWDKVEDEKQKETMGKENSITSLAERLLNDQQGAAGGDNQK